MGITKVISAYNTKRLLNYLEEVKYEDHIRNVGYFAVGVNPIDPYENFKTMLADKGKLNRLRVRNGQEKVYEGQHIITSFTREELNPNREEDIEKAREIMQDLMMDDYHNYGAVSVGYLQNDNGFLHFHRLYPTVSKDGKALRGEVYNFYHCAYKLDNAMEKYGVNQSILTMKERAEGYVKDDRKVLTGPKKNNRNEIKAYIAELIDEGLKDVNINTEDKFKEYLESKDISLNKRKRVGDSRKAGYDIYDWTYEYHYVDKGPKLKDKSMKVRAKQITDENGENIYNPDPITERLALNLKEFNRIAEENRKKREEEAKIKELSLEEKLEQITLNHRRVYNPETEKEEYLAKEEARKAETRRKENYAKIKAEAEAKFKKTSEKPINNEKAIDKDGNGVEDYHEALVNKRVKEIEDLDRKPEEKDEKPKQKVIRRTKSKNKGPSKSEFAAFMNHKFDGDDEKDDISFGR